MEVDVSFKNDGALSAIVPVLNQLNVVVNLFLDVITFLTLGDNLHQLLLPRIFYVVNDNHKERDA